MNPLYLKATNGIIYVSLKLQINPIVVTVSILAESRPKFLILDRTVLYPSSDLQSIGISHVSRRLGLGYIRNKISSYDSKCVTNTVYQMKDCVTNRLNSKLVHVATQFTSIFASHEKVRSL